MIYESRVGIHEYNREACIEPDWEHVYYLAGRNGIVCRLEGD